MEITDELIRKFLEKRCTSEEAEQVIRYLRQNPHVLEQYLGEKEWNDPMPESEGEEKVFQQAWEVIQQQKNPKSSVRWMKRTVAAAGIAGLLIAGYYFLQPAHQSPQPVLAAVATEDSVRNTSDTIVHVLMIDGSVVGLYPGSVIRFDTGYNRLRRNIKLEGEATFKVAKDRSRPFIVYNKGISVTAVGTFFSVKGTNASGDAEVRLYEGRVQVQKVKKDSLLSEVFLDPGMEVVYDVHTRLMNVSTFGRNMAQLMVRKKETAKTHSLPVIQGSYMFNNQSMKDVFRTLEVLYDVQIRYRPKDVDNLYFIGQFDNRDSLGGILKTICLLNNLRVTSKEDGKYSIVKNH